MIRKSFAASKLLTSDSPQLKTHIEFEETCGICNKEVPNGRLVLRHNVSRNIICLSCIIELADINE